MKQQDNIVINIIENNSEMDCNKNYIRYKDNNINKLILILSFIIVSAIISYNIVLIINAITYKNNIECNSYINVSDLLIVNGVIGLINLPLMIKYLNNPIYKMFSVLYLMMYSISVSMIYFKDCIGSLPTMINKLLLTSLIYNYIELLGKIINK